MKRVLAAILAFFPPSTVRPVAGKAAPFCLALFAPLLLAAPSDALTTAPKQFWFGEEHGTWTFADVFHVAGRDRTKAPAHSSPTGQDLAGFVIDIEIPGMRGGALLRGSGQRADCPWSPEKRKPIASACGGI